MIFLDIDWGRMGMIQMTNKSYNPDVDILVSFWNYGNIFYINKGRNIETNRIVKKILKLPETEKVLIIYDNEWDYRSVDSVLYKKSKCHVMIIRKCQHVGVFLNNDHRDIVIKRCDGIRKNIIKLIRINDHSDLDDFGSEEEVDIRKIKLKILFTE